MFPDISKTMDTLSKKIESVLFWKAEPVTQKELAKALNVSTEEIKTGIAELELELKERGVVLVRKEDEVILGTAPAYSALIEKLTKEELNRDLGKAGLETLSIVLYYGPIARSEIDYIRGVNSTFVLRNLMIRGLIERVSNKEDQRSFLYKPTFQLLSFLGITGVDQMPEYEVAREQLKTFKEAADAQSAEESEKNEPV